MSKRKVDEFLQGYVVAVANIINTHDAPQIAWDVLGAIGYDYDVFLKAGCDQYDLKVIRKLYRGRGMKVDGTERKAL